MGRKVKEYNTYAGTGSLPGGQAFSSYAYDTAGRLITATNQLSNPTVYTYDDAGHKLTGTDPNSKTTTYHYDVRGRLDKTTYPTLSSGTIISTTQRPNMSDGVTRGKVIICSDLDHFHLYKNKFAWLFRISIAVFENGNGTQAILGRFRTCYI